MVEGQGPVTPGNRRKRIGANSPASFAEDEIDFKTLKWVFFCWKAEKTMWKTGKLPICLQKRQIKCFSDDLRSKDMSNTKHYEWV